MGYIYSLLGHIWASRPELNPMVLEKPMFFRGEISEIYLYKRVDIVSRRAGWW